MREIVLPYSEAQREKFRCGTLMENWANTYPQIFDEQDVSICRNQPLYHFFEWLTAVTLFETTGYLSLIEKYETACHPRKIEVFKRVVPPAVFSDVMENHTSVPDLFLYSPSGDDWFFCEVKGGRDRLSAAQRARIKRLEAISGKFVLIAQFRQMLASPRSRERNSRISDPSSFHA